MRVQLLVTKNDFNLPNLEKEFKHLGVGYEIQYIEDNPKIVEEFQLRHSPNILVDGKLVFQRLPSEGELKAYFDQLCTDK